jgi:glycosyltransferase involved in cell wall biosynthesis
MKREDAEPRLTVVVPVRNESGNIAPLIGEIEQALSSFHPFEVIYVDDGSTDPTERQLLQLSKDRPWLRVVRHSQSCGQSAAVRTGVCLARAPIIVTIDGDGQNDPAFIPALIDALAKAGRDCGLVQGQRVGRHATGFRKFQSRVANSVRSTLLRDGTRDTGCGLKCFRREVYLALPYFDALHRFMPALVRRDGYGVALIDVVDRPRLSGRSNYGLFDRLWVGIVDLVGVRWLIKRRRRLPQYIEVMPDDD